MGMTLSEFYDSTPRELYNFIRAKLENRSDEVEQMYDYTRHIMWASIAAMSGDKAPSVSELIPLKRDKVEKELTPYRKQEVKKWNEEMDKEMLQIGKLVSIEEYMQSIT